MSQPKIPQGSRQRSSLFSSRSFRLSIVSSLAFVLIAALVIGLFSALRFYESDAVEEDAIRDELAELAAWISEDGLDSVTAVMSEEFGPVFPLEEAAHLVAEEEVLVRVLKNGEHLFGVAELRAPLGWSELTLALPQEEDHYEELFNTEDYEDVHFRVFSVEFGDDLTLIGARAPGYNYYVARELLESGLIWLLVIVAPLALLNGYFIARYVTRRLNSLSASMQKVATGELDFEIETDGSGDEFDRFATEINRMLAQIRTLMRNLEQVSTGVAHDLRTPLTRLDQRLQRIEMAADSPQVVREHLAAAQENIQTLLATFDALLRLGEIESGKRREKFQRISLSEVTEDVAETFEAVFAERGRKLSVSVLKGVEVPGDRDLLAQLIANLLENVLEHADPNGSAWVRLQPHSEGALLQIGDDGPGIPQHEKSKIFERFYRLDRSRQSPGNGLGLSLVASIVKLHGARLHLHDQQAGTVMDLIFPCER